MAGRMPTTTISLTPELVSALELLSAETNVSKAEITRQGLQRAIEERLRELIHVRLLRAGYEITPTKSGWTHPHGPPLTALEVRAASHSVTGCRELIAKIDGAVGLP